MSIAARKTKEKEAVRTLILTASWEIVEKNGWHALSMRKIADAIDYSAPVIYSHFSGKDAIMLVFIKRGFSKLNKALELATWQYPEPGAQIEALGSAYLHFGVTHRVDYEIMYGLGMPGCDTIREISELDAFTQILLVPIARMIKENNGACSDPVTKMRAFWSMLHGLVSLDRMDRHTEEVQRQAILGDLLENFIRGLGG